jgi:tetratricopeptide (TPR) repeat protein
MGRSRQSVMPARLPRDSGPDRPRSEDDAEVALRLAVTKVGLGLELARPARIGPLRLDAMTASLPGLTFPLDLSGGVPRFRHRRGALVRIEVALLREPMSRALGDRIQGSLGSEPAFMTLLPSGTGVLVGVQSGEAALAFEVAWAPLGRDVRLIVHSARALGLAEPAHAAALRVSETALRDFASRRGSMLRIDDAAATLLRQVMPRAGARTPDTAEIGWGSLSSSVEGFVAAAELGGLVPDVDDASALAVELAELCEEADDALVAGDHATARDRYLGVLERASHDREIAARLADLDRATGERTEAALATLVTAMPAIDAGALGGVLLAALGDRDGARVAFEAAAAREPYAPLSAMCLSAASEAAEDAGSKRSLLGQAGARAPTSLAIRWRKLSAALAEGDAKAALAEAEHLEAAARGVHEKQATLLEAGRRFAAKGHAARATLLFERALRYRPTHEDALVGLGESLFALGHAARASEVLGRALALATRRGAVRHDASLMLARVLGDGLGDLPKAIARARSVPIEAAEHASARAVEGRWLAELGDRSAASIAYARMREALEHVAVDPRVAVDDLRAAAALEMERDDAHAAKLHLALALRLAPRDAAVRVEFRRAAERVDERPDAPPIAPRVEPPRPPMPKIELAPEPSRSPIANTSTDLEPNVLDEAREEDLSNKLRATPEDRAVARELVGVLSRLGKHLELLALASGRLEEGDEEMGPVRDEVLAKLAQVARDEGRPGEAEMYEGMIGVR